MTSSSSSSSTTISVDEAMDTLRRTYEENHPGTTSGCLDVLSQDLERVVNRLVSETIANGARSQNGTKLSIANNTLYEKIDYLYGQDVQMLDEFGALVDFDIQRKISNNVRKLFHNLRRRRNDAVHDRVALYDVINDFRDLVVETGPNTRFVFKVGEDCDIRLVPPDDTTIKPADVDFTNGDAHNHDLLIEAYTRAEFQTTVHDNGFDLSKSTHVVVIYYGNKKDVFLFSRRLWDQWKRIFFGTSAYHRRTLYFKFNMERLISRIKYP